MMWFGLVAVVVITALNLWLVLSDETEVGPSTDDRATETDPSQTDVA